MSRYRTLLSLGAVVLVVGVSSLIATGAIHSAPPTPTVQPTFTALPSSTATAAPPDLSGTWTGTYFGPSNGFCTLTLTKTGNGFDGTFILSPPLDKFLHVTGNLVGSAITLRSASGVIITGTLSGSTLSGAYVSNGMMYSWSVSL
jgi:hypothetical protein